MPKLEQRINRLEVKVPPAEKRAMIDVSMLSTSTLKELMANRRTDGGINLDNLSDAALAEFEAACIAKRGDS